MDNNFILSLFQHGYKSRWTTAYFVLTGKKTSSALIYMNFYQIKKYFNIAPKYSKAQFEHQINELVEAHYLVRDQQYVTITPAGLQQLQQLPALNDLDNFRYTTVNQQLRDLLLLVTQVLSEKAYQNTQYAPVINQLQTQLYVKRKIAQISVPQETFITTYAEELWQFSQSLSQLEQLIFLAPLQGHADYGQTLMQIQQESQLSAFMVQLIYINCLHKLITAMQKGDYPTLSYFYYVSPQLPSHLQLCLDYLRHNLSITEVAQKLRRKEGTVIDYMLELSMLGYLDLRAYIQPDHWALFESYAAIQPNVINWSYQDAFLQDHTFTFAEFRFYQLVKGVSDA